MSAAERWREDVSTHGFTLIEMLVVIAVTALVAGIGFPAVESQLQRIDLVAASNATVLALRETRAAAIRRDLPARIALSGDRRGLARDGTSVYTPPAGIALALPAAGIVFYPDGTAGPGTVAVTSAAGRRTLTVDALTGAVGEAR